MMSQLTHLVLLRELLDVEQDNHNKVGKSVQVTATRVTLGKVLTMIVNETKFKAWNSKTNLTFLPTSTQQPKGDIKIDD